MEGEGEGEGQVDGEEDNDEVSGEDEVIKYMKYELYGRKTSFKEFG